MNNDVQLRTMTEPELREYKVEFIEGYADDIQENYNLSREESLQKSELAFDDVFPQCVVSAGHEVYSIEADDNVVGYIWYFVDDKAGKAYIYDFMTFEQFRSKGYGRSVIALVEAKLTKLGIQQLGLRVAYNNPRALALYQKLGFAITGLNMNKTLSTSA